MLSLIDEWFRHRQNAGQGRRTLLEQLATSWGSLSARRRIIAIGASVAVFAAVLLLARSAAAPEMALLYSGLEPQAAGDVVAALEQSGVAHEVRGSSIYVASTERDTLRMTLASQGLPANSSQGYELLDSLSGFGTTSQMFDAAYWRAKEGELARTIVASPQIRSARVHISTPTNRAFQRDARSTASVTVTPAGGALSPGQARAFRYLVASAVPGLNPEDVAVIDSEAGLVTDAADDGARGANNRSEALRDQAQRLLEARVGTGNAIVEVSMETVTESESIRERRVDPQSRIAISTNVEERTSSSADAGAGDVTVASNIPDGDAAESETGSNRSQSSETRELTNYDLSETNREILRAPGAVKRLTVAVLVNDTVTVSDTGETVRAPRTEEELVSLGELVSSAVGLNAERGDVLTIRSMSFEPVPELGTEVTEAGGGALDMMSLIQLGVLALVTLVLGLFVVRPILSQSRAPALPAPDSAGPASADGAWGGPPMVGAGDFGGYPMIDATGTDMGAGEDETADPVTRLKRLIAERQDDTVRILQSWIEDPEDKREA